MDSIFFDFVDKEKVKRKLESGEFPFSQYLFWDTAIENIDIKKHRRYIIERVITRGKLQDLYMLLKIYGNEEISDCIVRSRILDKKTANFCSIAFNIPKSQINVSPYYD